jgi:anaerobic ribonucleoside-triphosphate reductase activating protein
MGGSEAGASHIVVSRTLDRCTVLGPGIRAVIWVQGCPLRCEGCLAAETLPFDGGTIQTVTALASWLTGLEGIEGVTFSGGEPFAQAGSLALLLDEVRKVRPGFTAMSYSGFTQAALRRGTEEQRALLGRLDLLIDGPYQRGKHGSFRWRGSSNQRLIPLSDRYGKTGFGADTGQGIEFALGLDGTLSWAGVPAEPGFRERLESGLLERGFGLLTEGSDRPGDPVTGREDQ